MVTKTVVTVGNLHLIVTALPSSKYFGIQWKVASFELKELSDGDSHIRKTKGRERI